MSSVFTKIIQGDLPARFVWRDASVVAFLSINPLTPGHTLVVPIRETDHWIDLDAGEWAHVAEVSRQIALAINDVWPSEKVALMLLGYDVPHVHAHLVATSGVGDIDFATADLDPDPAEMDDAATKIRNALTVREATGVAAA